jgi:hypothetical protein
MAVIASTIEVLVGTPREARLHLSEVGAVVVED